MADNAGIFVTQVGASVATAADYQFVFNSNWPSLQTAFDQNVSLPANSFAPVTVSHNLGFYPLTFVYLTLNGRYVGRADIGNSDVSCNIGKNTLYLTNGSSTNAYIANVACYNIDLTKPVDYTLPKYPAVNAPYDSTVGIKVSKYGKPINSTDLRDFILHSRAQSPAILSIVTEKSAKASPFGGSLSRLTYTNPANYIPWITGYTANTGTIYEPLIYQSANWAIQSAGLSINNTTTTLDFNPATGGATLVVLRDPLIVANAVQVTY